MFKGLIGKKIGMTQIFDETGAALPVTLIEAGPCYVTQVRLPEKEGYAAVQLEFLRDETQTAYIRSTGSSQEKRIAAPAFFA